MAESDEMMEDESLGEQKRMDGGSIESLREQKRMDDGSIESLREQKRMDDGSIESLREGKRMKMTTEVELYSEGPDEIEKCPDEPDEVFNAFIAQYNWIGCKYTQLDRLLASEGHGFTENYEIWSHGYFIDMQYKELYEYLKDNYFEQVVKDKMAIKELKPCRTQEIAEEFTAQYKYCFDAMDEWEIHACLKDLVKDIMILEELEILKEYELILLESGYWKNGGHEDDNNVPCYKDYGRDRTFYLTGYNLIDVQEDFEKWIFKLESCTDKEKKDAVERDHQNRKANLPIHTRAQYTLKKLERADKSKIISMEILKKKIRERFRGPDRQDRTTVCSALL